MEHLRLFPLKPLSDSAGPANFSMHAVNELRPGALTLELPGVTAGILNGSESTVALMKASVLSSAGDGQVLRE